MWARRSSRRYKLFSLFLKAITPNVFFQLSLWWPFFFLHLINRTNLIHIFNTIRRQKGNILNNKYIKTCSGFQYWIVAEGWGEWASYEFLHSPGHHRPWAGLLRFLCQGGVMGRGTQGPVDVPGVETASTPLLTLPQLRLQRGAHTPSREAVYSSNISVCEVPDTDWSRQEERRGDPWVEAITHRQGQGFESYWGPFQSMILTRV